MKFNNWTELSFFAAVLLSCYLFAEQLVIAVMAVSKNAYNASVFSIYVVGAMVVLGSGMLKYVYKSIENTAGISVYLRQKNVPRRIKKVAFFPKDRFYENRIVRTAYMDGDGVDGYSSSKTFSNYPRRTDETRFENNVG